MKEEKTKVEERMVNLGFLREEMGVEADVCMSVGLKLCAIKHSSAYICPKSKQDE